MDMKVNIAGVEWKNPVTVASGTFGSGEEFGEFVDLNRLGAVTTKGVANVPWPGNPTPRVAEVIRPISSMPVSAFLRWTPPPAPPGWAAMPRCWTSAPMPWWNLRRWCIRCPSTTRNISA